MNKHAVPMDVSTDYSLRFHSLDLQITIILGQVLSPEAGTWVLWMLQGHLLAVLFLHEPPLPPKACSFPQPLCGQPGKNVHASLLIWLGNVPTPHGGHSFLLQVQCSSPSSGSWLPPLHQLCKCAAHHTWALRALELEPGHRLRSAPTLAGCIN